MAALYAANAHESTRTARRMDLRCAERAESLDTPRTSSHDSPVRAAEREDRVLSLLRTHGRVSVEDLASEVGVTTSTIRRDLQRLSDGGRVVRTYGGAAFPGPRLADIIDPAAPAKERIAAAAAGLIQDGSTIVVASGSTTLAFARHLVDREDLTVITNALDVAWTLVDRPGIDLIVLGGAIRPGMHSMLGHLTEMASRELRADQLFVGIGAISLEHGLMNDSVPEIMSDRALRRMARRCIVLADARKFDLVAPAYVFGLDEVDTIVTNDAARTETVDALRERGIEVIVA
jgi:DeoR family transcriptional regulator of aga operon/DeoR family fructose operon transcriptional repressor